MKSNPNTMYISKDYSLLREDSNIKDNRKINIEETIYEVTLIGSSHTSSQEWRVSTSLIKCEVIPIPKIFYSLREKFEDIVHNIDGISIGLRNENAKLWFYYLTDDLFTDEKSIYSNVDGRLYRFGINRNDVNILILKKNNYPTQCKKIEEALNIFNIPCLIVSKERLNIPKNEAEDLIKPKEYAILQRGIFVEELCKDINKLDELIYDIYNGVKKGESLPKLIRNIKWRAYVGKAYEEIKDWISF